MGIYGYPRRPQDVDLFGSLFAPEEDVFSSIYLVRNLNSGAICSLSVLVIRDTPGIWSNCRWVDGGVAFAVEYAVGIVHKSSGQPFGRFSDRFFQVAARRRHRSDKGDGARLSVVQEDDTGAGVEVGNDYRQVHHQEGIKVGQFFHAVRHLAQGLRPAGR